jgi:hypothetical protein
MQMGLCYNSECTIQNDSRGKVSILGGQSIGHSKQKMYMYMCPIPNGVRDRAISLCNALYTLYIQATRHVLTRAAKCIDFDGKIFENVLYYLNCTNFFT